LPGALLIGLAFAKGLALRLNKPLVPVDHLAAHLHAAYLAAGRPQQACLGVVLSGGHTLLCIRRGIAFELLGETRDDAMGESFDKVAKLMGLGYPGGPVIDRLAQQGNPQAIGFVRAQTKHRFDFSFSGLKTAVLQYLKGHTQPQQAQEVSAPAAALLPDLAASFQECAVDMVVHRITRAVEETGLRTVLLGGGVTLNTRLRARLHQVAHERGFGVVFPPAVLCSDNGAMIAAAAFDLYERGVFAPLALMPEPDLCLTPFNQTVEA
jgi:N6-L-threonylcarbamoyladenine synthase